MWLLLFAALLPAVIAIIPLAALAGVLVHAGCKLIPVKDLLALWHRHRGEAVILVVTALTVVFTDLFQGVLLGLLLAVVKTAWEVSHIHVEVHELTGARLAVSITGNATFLRLPPVLDRLEKLPRDRPVQLDLSRLRHLDHACRVALESWAVWHNGSRPERVTILPPAPAGNTVR